MTPSMLSGWELGRHVTSIAHRAMLCEIFGQPPDFLFAHQDEHLASGPAGPQLLAGWDALQAAMLSTVTDARECLVVTGSRSRDPKYLAAIETVLAERPSLVCYRVLFGPPHHQVLKNHLLELLRLRDPGDRSLGIKALHVGMVVWLAPNGRASRWRARLPGLPPVLGTCWTPAWTPRLWATRQPGGSPRHPG